MKNEPAYPVPEENRLSNGEYNNAGLTKRELFAARAMQGAISGYEGGTLTYRQAAYDAVAFADALIKELEK